MGTLLVLTLGQTDVQIVIDEVRHELRKDHCAALHDEIEGREWCIVDAPDGKADTVDRFPRGDLLLCTPKLDAVLRVVVPTAALLLETRRDPESVPSDPRFAGAVVNARLKAKGIETVHRKAYLQGAERLEDRNQPRDAVIRREVVGRLQDAVRESLAAMKPLRIVVAATGGFPVVSSLVEEIVRLHAPTSAAIESLEIADGAQANPPGADRAVPRTSVPEPLVSFRSRRRALELIEKGNLLGAWAVAEPLHTDENERTWTKVIEWLARFASSLPIPDDCDIVVLKHPRIAARAALRVEFTLRAGDIPRAVHGTVAFFEAALWDHLSEKTSRHPSKRQFKFHDGPPKKLVRECDAAKLAEMSKTKQRKNRDRPFIFKETANGSDWYWIDDNGICAIRIAEHFLKLDSLTKLGQTLAGDIRELRNDIAHNEPTPKLMNDARHKMVKAQLWSNEDYFSTQPLVQNVLAELGVSEPGNLCKNLLAVVRERLIAEV